MEDEEGVRIEILVIVVVILAVISNIIIVVAIIVQVAGSTDGVGTAK
jgi:hypothetical protein